METLLLEEDETGSELSTLLIAEDNDVELVANKIEDELLTATLDVDNNDDATDPTDMDDVVDTDEEIALVLATELELGDLSPPPPPPQACKKHVNKIKTNN